MTTLFGQMMSRGHERVCFHHDPETGLRAIIAVHSTKLGNALGGTRRWFYPSENEAIYDVLRLSEGMTYKAAAAGLPMGGAKSVILLPRNGHPSSESEARAMGRFVDTFGGAYIAAEDVGVDTQYVDWMAAETKHVMGGMTVSVGGDPSPYTAKGVINGMKACLAHIGKPESFRGLTVAIQGLGHVGFKVAKFVIEDGGTVYGADINKATCDRATKELGVKIVSDAEILSTPCDILAPCALGGVVNGTLARKLKCKILCGGANNILDDPDEDAVILKNAGIVYGPDFVVNAGGLIRLAGLYLGMSERDLDQKVADVQTTTAQILREAQTMSSTYASALAVVHRRIAEGSGKRVAKPSRTPVAAG